MAADAGTVAAWPAEHRRNLQQLIYRQARDGFQYCYASVPLFDIWRGAMLPGHFFNRLVAWLNAPPFLGFVRAVTGDGTIAFADAQATRFDPLHFLTCHDDAVAGKGRRAAYVLSLSPLWRPDWGGALQFFDAAGSLTGGYTPTFNALCLFRVPSAHSVGIVAPFAGASRYSVTGWLRTGDPSA